MTTTAKARFAQLVLPRMDEAYRLARWLTGNATDAEDVMQEACLRAYRSIETFAEGNARSWFLTIVRNASYSWLEKHRLSTVVFIDDLDPKSRLTLETGNSIADVPRTPEQVLIAKNETLRLVAAVEALPILLREAIVLREYHGLSYREIADVTAVPIGTVMSRLANGRRHLLNWAKEGGR
ncbi:MAG TPA: sigma-70 family RNA polymerase sigma factor [Rhizobium sp.]